MRKIKGIVATILSLGMVMAGSLTSFAAELTEQRLGEVALIESTASDDSYEDPDYRNCCLYVKGNGVRLRREAGDGEIVGLLYENAKDWVTLSGAVHVISGSTWLEVKESSIGYQGWVLEDYLKGYGPNFG